MTEEGLLDKKYDLVHFNAEEMRILLFEMDKRYRRALKQLQKDEARMEKGFSAESQAKLRTILNIVRKIEDAEIKPGAGFRT